MRGLDTRSTLIGILMAAVVILGIAAASNNDNNGRYSFSLAAGSSPGTFLICIGDTSSGKYSIEKCVEQIPATSSMMTHIGTFSNPLAAKPTE